MRVATFAIVIGTLVGSVPVFAQCGGSQLCAAGPGTCVVSQDCTITVPLGGLTIDLGARNLIITKNLTVAGPEGAPLTIKAGSVTLDGGAIFSPGANNIAGMVVIQSAGDITVKNGFLIDVSAALTAGLVDLEAGGNMAFGGRIKANGTTRASEGGDVTLFANGMLTANGTMIDATAGDMGFGGSIDIETLNGSVFVTEPLNASGGDAGDITLFAGTTLQMTANAKMKVSATGDAGSGGSIDIEAVNDVTVGADMTGTGSPAISSEDQQSGGDGADVSILSDTGNTTVNGKIEVSAAAAGSGGTIDLEAALNLSFTRPLVTQSTGVDGVGGDVVLTAGGPLSITQQINAGGATGSGGSLDAFTTGNLTMSSTILTDGDSFGGFISLQGCQVNVMQSAILSARGPGLFPAGANLVLASSTMMISGTLQATSENLLQTKMPPGPTFGSKPVTPPPTTELNPSLPCCVNCPATTTTSTTTSTTSTSIQVTTSTVATTTTSTTTSTTSTTTSTTSTTTTTTSTTTSTTIGNTCGEGPDPCGPCQTCDTASGECVAAVRQSCLLPVEAAAGSIDLKKSLKGPDKDKVDWKWNKGAATTLGDFGNPVTTDSFAFCVFDRSQQTPSLLFRAEIAADGTCGKKAKPCWAQNSDKGFTFKNSDGNATGVTAVMLVAGADGKAKVQLKGKGTGLSGRAFGLTSPPVPVPLTAQLQSSNGACWEATFSRSGLKKNDDEEFKGKSD